MFETFDDEKNIAGIPVLWINNLNVTSVAKLTKIAKTYVDDINVFTKQNEDKLIMAGGTFVQGSSIELSADGPVRPPYTIFMQGGLVFEHSMLGILGAAEEILKHR